MLQALLLHVYQQPLFYDVFSCCYALLQLKERAAQLECWLQHSSCSNSQDTDLVQAILNHHGQQVVVII